MDQTAEQLVIRRINDLADKIEANAAEARLDFHIPVDSVGSTGTNGDAP